MPASQATSLECCRQFWPYDVRYFIRPTSFTSSGCRPCTPTSKQALSPSSLRCTSISCLTLLTTSSMRAGWMRPSAISRCSAQPRDLAAVGIVGGDQHGLRRVVHDEVDAGVQLERADVAALAADDAALHVVAGQVHHRHRGLDGVVRAPAAGWWWPGLPWPSRARSRAPPPPAACRSAAPRAGPRPPSARGAGAWPPRR